MIRMCIILIMLLSSAGFAWDGYNGACSFPDALEVTEYFNRYFHPEPLQGCGSFVTGSIYGNFSAPDVFEVVAVLTVSDGLGSFPDENNLFRYVDGKLELVNDNVGRGNCLLQNTLVGKDILICLADTTFGDYFDIGFYWDMGFNSIKVNVVSFDGDEAIITPLLTRENLRVDYESYSSTEEACDEPRLPYYSYYQYPRIHLIDHNSDAFPDLRMVIRHRFVPTCYHKSYGYRELRELRNYGEWVDYELIWLFDGLGYTPTEETAELLEHIESFDATEAPYVIDRTFTGK